MCVGSQGKKSDVVIVKFYSLNGKLQSKGSFLHKNRVGRWTYYFQDGKKMSEEFYKEGRLEGKLINYYPNGKETEISFYKKGFIMPASGIITGVYGSQRVLNGKPRRPHYGLDIANILST